MGSVTFTCDCGEGLFLESTDNRSYVAHLIPDQRWGAIWEAIDAAVETSGPSPKEKESACMHLRHSFHQRQAWQCYQCGTLYLEGPDGTRHRFHPASPSTPKNLLSAPALNPIDPINPVDPV